MNALRFLLVLSVLCSFCVMGGGAKAGFKTDNVEFFVPTSAWLVGQASLLPVPDSGFLMPCVMMNQYNNGYVVRFSGGKEQIMAMAVDFRWDNFKAGSSYDVGIHIAPDFNHTVSATAHDKGTLLVDVLSNAELYGALKRGKYMYLTVGGKDFNFALLGVSDGLQRVEQCYNPDQKPDQRAAVASPPYSRALQQKRPSLPEEAQSEDKTLMPMPPALAEEMSTLNSMLQGSAKKLADLNPAAGNAEFSKAGDDQKAVVKKIQPIGKPLANTWSSPINSSGKGLEQRDIIVAGHAPSSSVSVSRERQWRVMRGHNLHEILDIWAQSENVRLIWKAEQEFLVKKSVSMKGSFEDAVLDILEQYDERKRPVGRIYIDSVLNQKVLIVEIDKGS